MTCDPERVTGFVDGELTAEAAAELAAHLESCPSCRAQAEAERELRARLRGLPSPALPAGLEARVREARRARPFATRTVRWALPVAAVLLAGIWLRTHAPFVAWDLARDHDKCFSRQPLPAQVWSREPLEVASWFERQGTRLPTLPAQVGELELVGARYCPLASLSMAPHIYYRSAASRASVFVVPQGVRLGDELSFETRGERVRLLRIAGEVVGIVGAREDEVEAFDKALRPLLTAWARSELTERAKLLASSGSGRP